ncbi:hypothetical protein V6N13_079239 [Hibiscus sabdariffa]
MAPSTDIPNLQFQIPYEAEARCPFTGQNQSFRPVNKQAATHGHLSQLPFSRQNQSFRLINEQAVTQDHLSRLPFTGQNQSLCPINKRAVTHGHHPQFPTGKNQSFCPINEQSVIHGHLPQLPFKESQASSGNLNKLIIQTKVLLAYIQHKKSVMFARDDTPFSFLNHMHSTFCCRRACKCYEFYKLASHYEGCHDARCEICIPVRYTVNRFCPDLEHVERGLARVSGEGDFDQQPLPKRLKLENPTSPCLPCKGMFYGMAPAEAQPSFTDIPPFVQLQESFKSSNSEIKEANVKLLPKLLEDSTISQGMGMAQFQVQPSSTDLPPLVQLPDCPVSSNFEVMEVNIELQPKLLEDPTVAKGMGKNMEVNTELLPKHIEDFTSAKESNKTMEANTELLSNLVEDSICTYKEEDIAFVNGTDNADNARDHFNKMEFNALTSLSEELAARCEKGETKARANSNQAELEMKTELISQQLNCGKETKLESQKQRGVSLIENFTAQQIKEHISSLRKYIDQDLGKKERQNGIANVDSKDSCQLCGAVKLSLSPAPIYCSSCCARIRRGAMYYSIPEVIPEANGIGNCLCSVCYNASRSQGITSSGISVSKTKLIKMKNDDEPEEWWVQCDKCKCWQHQICALFNERRKKRRKDFVCPKCCLKEIENGERMPPPVRTVFGAKDLPRTMLSDHLEERLSRCLQKNREEKARATGMSIDEVPEAQGLVVREVLSVQKVVKVNKQLLDILQDQNYPAEFPYKSKVILLFQNIEGADVCLYIMPETETAAGREVLRTVVYHEILVGYLEYCKKRGFTTCYIWACPPRKGEDYILHCHPEGQKIPKSEKLRQWHKNMLQKAAEAGIVVDLTNLYDQFFTTGKYNTKVTAAHLPYFDGDYWSGAAEDAIEHIEKASGEDFKNMSMKYISKRTLQAMGHTNPSGHAIKDILLMQKLGQNILPMKEDFIIAHLQFICVCCHTAIIDGCRWSCHMCKSFQLCGRCHDEKQSTYKDSTHTLWNGEKHSLCMMMVDDVSFDTDEKDVCIDNGLFEDRYKFLMFCQKNNYQFDTLRRAKHSSMMILYYLHNPKAWIASSNCCICNKDTPIDKCWHCETCLDFFVCAACYRKDGCSMHIHKLTSHSSDIDSSTENRETAMNDILSKLLEVLLHAAQCRCCCRCSYPCCDLMRKLFSHSKRCTVRAPGGCMPCQKIWFMLILHSRNCQESDCAVPRCRDIKQHAIGIEECGILKKLGKALGIQDFGKIALGMSFLH